MSTQVLSLLFGSQVMLGLVVLTAFYLVWRVTENTREMHKDFIADVRTLTERVLMLKGLQPHHIDPETYMPGGMSREVYEQMKADAPAPAEPVDVASDEKEWRDEMKSDLTEHLAMVRQQNAERDARLKADAQFEQGLSQSADDAAAVTAAVDARMKG